MVDVVMLIGVLCWTTLVHSTYIDSVGGEIMNGTTGLYDVWYNVSSEGSYRVDFTNSRGVIYTEPSRSSSLDECVFYSDHFVPFDDEFHMVIVPTDGPVRVIGEVRISMSWANFIYVHWLWCLIGVFVLAIGTFVSCIVIQGYRRCTRKEWSL